MNKKLWLLLVLPITLALQAVPAIAGPTCGTGGNFFVSCTRTCTRPGVTTSHTAQGIGSSCSAAISACHLCIAACPQGQTETLHNGTCASVL